MSDALTEAMNQPNGARFFKVALQVNPFSYQRHGRGSGYDDEDAYNAAMVVACHENDVEVIGVTDHHRVDTAASLIAAARESGIHALPGFEACTSEGVHFLCLFDESESLDDVKLRLGEFGIRSTSNPDQLGNFNAAALLDMCHKRWDALCVAAHACADSGLLTTLSGQSCIDVWKHQGLLACGLPSAAKDAPADKVRIVLNKEKAYKRDFPVAVLNCSDVSCPDDFSKSSASCWVKMTDVSIEGLRDACRDPQSRVRLASDPAPVDHSEIVAIAWEGGFLDGLRLHLSDNLNALIGGRGTGKSTIIESIRYALDLEPLGDEARIQHEGCVKKVIGPGTTVSLVIRTYTPSRGEYVVERTVHGRPTVKNSTDEMVEVTPIDLLPGTELYGQHEISELARDGTLLTELLDRYVPQDDSSEDEADEIRKSLRHTREAIIRLIDDIDELEDQVASLPKQEEKLKQYKKLGLDQKLRDRTDLDTEKSHLKEADEVVQAIRDDLAAWREDFPLDTASLSDDAAQKLPASAELKAAQVVLDELSKAVANALDAIEEASEVADKGLGGVRADWDTRREAVEAEYKRLLRELKKQQIDGDEFRRLSERVRELKAMKRRLKARRQELKEAKTARNTTVTAWEKHKAEKYRELAKTAKSVSKKLKGIVQVEVIADGDITVLDDHIRTLPGRKQELINSMYEAEGLQLQELAKTAREGAEALQDRYGMPLRQAKDFSEVSEGFLLELEELAFTPTTEVYLNVADSGEAEIWKSLNDLSTGQKATAVLMMLLLDSSGPLIIDQPEDDLDNRFIARDIIDRMRQQKRKRQFVFSTHNANIPVLGDAELIVGLEAAGDADEEGNASIEPFHRGSIDAPAIKKLVKDVLEGGDRAFRLRKQRYGLSE